MAKKVTIKDVAREAGVAISTVSNALNNSDLVNEETKARILEIAEYMNYTPQPQRTLFKIIQDQHARFPHLQHWRRLFHYPSGRLEPAV